MSSKILTIGYARATQDGVLSALIDAGVEVLADIRALPLSRRPGFSKTSLAEAIEQAGMQYRHFRHLGTPKEGRDAARRGDRGTLKRIYEGQLELPEALAQMAELQALAQAKRTCLLCYCEETADCHRALLIDAAFADWTCLDLHPHKGLS
ncbi:DUF488 domain-containing protein [Erythrobacter alti]|uniref:DUF488 domain-containing protein n=1 Tax=Erythrobacter alti TaxID=1896145 RepID=UPI0030F3F910